MATTGFWTEGFLIGGEFDIHTMMDYLEGAEHRLLLEAATDDIEHFFPMPNLLSFRAGIMESINRGYKVRPNLAAR